MNAYIPQPIDLSDIVLTEDLIELSEAIAENVHDVWASERRKQGWTYGVLRNDERKETPCMVPYAQLPESEKHFDRETAMNTLKLVRKLGYDLVKRENTDLHNEFLSKASGEEETFYCSQCWSKGIETPVEKHQIFCQECGCDLKLEGLHKA